MQAGSRQVRTALWWSKSSVFTRAGFLRYAEIRSAATWRERTRDRKRVTANAHRPGTYIPMAPNTVIRRSPERESWTWMWNKNRTLQSAHVTPNVATRNQITARRFREKSSTCDFFSLEYPAMTSPPKEERRTLGPAALTLEEDSQDYASKYIANS